MPIKGLTDRQPNHPVIGKIRKGSEKQIGSNGKSVMGKDLETFRVTSQMPDVLEEWEQVHKSHGGLFPKQIGIVLPYPKLEQNFIAWYEEWKATSLVRRCDGESQHIWLTEKNTYSRQHKPCLGCPNNEGKTGCKQTATLKFLKTSIKRHFGLFEFETHSKWDIINIYEALAAVEQSLGTLQGVPFVLYREKREVSTPAFGSSNKRNRVEKSFVKIRLHGSYSEPLMQAIEMATERKIAALTASLEEPSSLPPSEQRALPEYSDF